MENFEVCVKVTLYLLGCFSALCFGSVIVYNKLEKISK